MGRGFVPPSEIIRPEDVTETFIAASGPGGQNVNKVATCVQLVHKPTGIVIKCREERTQVLNRKKAWDLLGLAIRERRDAKRKMAVAAREKKRRQNRRRSQASKERMLQAKKKRSIIKKGRKGVLENE